MVETKKVRFAHLADLHLGAWREKSLRKLNFLAFKKSIHKILVKKVDFVLFAGDIFNNAMPPIEIVESVVVELMKLKKANIPIFVIGGSHDYSNLGKSFISLLESTGVFVDVSKPEFIDENKINLSFFEDFESQTLISGVLGKKNGLDKNIYANLNSPKFKDDKFKIFMFHCALGDIKPEGFNIGDSKVTSSYLPKGFDYYAGGHVHSFIESKYCEKKLSYPGPLFPNNFLELKKERPSFNFCEFDFENRETKIIREFIEVYNKEFIKVEIDELNPIEAREKIISKIESIDLEEKIFLLEICGIVDGKICDIGINKILAQIYDKGVLCVLKKTIGLTSNLTSKIDLTISQDAKQIEEEVILATLKGEGNFEKKVLLAKKLLEIDFSKNEEEKNQDFEDRVKKKFEKIYIENY